MKPKKIKVLELNAVTDKESRRFRGKELSFIKGEFLKKKGFLPRFSGEEGTKPSSAPDLFGEDNERGLEAVPGPAPAPAPWNKLWCMGGGGGGSPAAMAA